MYYVYAKVFCYRKNGTPVVGATTLNIMALNTVMSRVANKPVILNAVMLNVVAPC